MSSNSHKKPNLEERVHSGLDRAINGFHDKVSESNFGFLSPYLPGYNWKLAGKNVTDGSPLGKLEQRVSQYGSLVFDAGLLTSGAIAGFGLGTAAAGPIGGILGAIVLGAGNHVAKRFLYSAASYAFESFNKDVVQPFSIYLSDKVNKNLGKAISYFGNVAKDTMSTIAITGGTLPSIPLLYLSAGSSALRNLVPYTQSQAGKNFLRSIALAGQAGLIGLSGYSSVAQITDAGSHPYHFDIDESLSSSKTLLFGAGAGGLSYAIDKFISNDKNRRIAKLATNIVLLSQLACSTSSAPDAPAGDFSEEPEMITEGPLYELGRDSYFRIVSADRSMACSGGDVNGIPLTAAHCVSNIEGDAPAIGNLVRYETPQIHALEFNKNSQIGQEVTQYFNVSGSYVGVDGGYDIALLADHGQKTLTTATLADSVNPDGGWYYVPVVTHEGEYKGMAPLNCSSKAPGFEWPTTAVVSVNGPDTQNNIINGALAAEHIWSCSGEGISGMSGSLVFDEDGKVVSIFTNGVVKAYTDEHLGIDGIVDPFYFGDLIRAHSQVLDPQPQLINKFFSDDYGTYVYVNDALNNNGIADPMDIFYFLRESNVIQVQNQGAFSSAIAAYPLAFDQLPQLGINSSDLSVNSLNYYNLDQGTHLAGPRQDTELNILWNLNLYKDTLPYNETPDILRWSAWTNSGNQITLRFGNKNFIDFGVQNLVFNLPQVNLIAGFDGNYNGENIYWPYGVVEFRQELP